MIVNNCYDEMRFNPSLDRRTKLKTKSVLCVPIIMGAQITAVVEMVNKKSGDFHVADQSLLEAMGQVIAPGLTSPLAHKNMKVHQEAEMRILKQAISGDR